MKFTSISSYYESKLITVPLLTIILPLMSACSSGNSEPVHEDFNVDNFTQPTVIDNEWFPLKPGMHAIYEGTTTEDGETSSHRIEFTVTDLTKKIMGVQTVVALLADFSDDELVEKEIAFYAQDNAGNVWFFGEYPEEYEDGVFVKAPTWIAGIEDAKAGIKMRANPQPGEPSYFQGWGPKVDWSDFGQVEKAGEKTCVPVNCYENVLVIAESSLDEENAFQLKYYARGVGEVRVGWRGDDASQEELELVKLTQLDPEDMKNLRTEALELERNAYKISKNVYGRTPPIESVIAKKAITRSTTSPTPEQAVEGTATTSKVLPKI